MKTLKLHLVINSKEYEMHDDSPEANVQGFESLMTHDWLSSENVKEICEQGFSDFEMSTEAQKEIIRDILDRDDIEDVHEAVFVMCLWETDEEYPFDEEHIKSDFTLQEISHDLSKKSARATDAK